MNIQLVVKRILPVLALMHHKNWTSSNRAYPQLWYSWPIKRRTRARRMLEKACGRITGHEISKTEWGYGGGKCVDRHCRWCDKLIQVPLSEEVVPVSLTGLMEELTDDSSSSGIEGEAK